MSVGSFVMGEQSVHVPTFFPSVSSVRANGKPSEYVRVLAATSEPRFLVSAYDVGMVDAPERDLMDHAIAAAIAAGARVLLDSGNYESFWKQDIRWTADRYDSVLRSTDASVAFCFDNQTPPANPRASADEIVASVERGQACAARTSVCPIVHGRNVEDVELTTRIVAEHLQPLLLGVPERELGEGVIARARAVRRICLLLREVAPSTCLHLLGTGSPIALLIYSIVGAQSFDGLEWCHTCVDPNTARLHHFQHRDLVGTTDPPPPVDLDYTTGTLVHNVFFFRSWIARIREALAADNAYDLLESVLPASRRAEVLAALRAT